MAKHFLYPLIFAPVFKDYIWGGRNLEYAFGRQLPSGLIAESWEIAAHQDGTVRVNNGPYAGLLLTELHAKLGLELIGYHSTWAQERGKFPLLIKLLDANHHLSLQVHPDDAYALEHEGNELGKSEMWVILQAQPNASIILGVKAGTTPTNFRQAIVESKLEPYLHRIPVQTGDVICVPSGSLHAILEGLVIAEIQQNSNTTYRVYDWNRLSDRKPRALHVEQALQVINFDQVEPTLCQPRLISDRAGVRRFRLCHNKYFVTERVQMEEGAVYQGCCDGSTLEIWGAIEGSAEINGVRLEKICFTLLPAALGDFTVTARARDVTLLRTYVDLPNDNFEENCA